MAARRPSANMAAGRIMMTHRAIPLLLIAAVAGGCAPLPQTWSRRELVQQALESAAVQAGRCYRAPRVSFRGRQFITRLRIRLTPEGDLAGLPVVLMQDGVTPDNQTYAEPMAQAAVEAVMRCAPFRLPPALYVDGWSNFDLTFSPLSAA